MRTNAPIRCAFGIKRNSSLHKQETKQQRIMFIEKWKDTAFGSDYGNDFLQLLEQIPVAPLSLSVVYEHCDLQQYIEQPERLNQRSDNNVRLSNTGFEQYVHYEDAVIALAAIVAESQLNGSADLSQAYGSKTLVFDLTKAELISLKEALQGIHSHPDHFVLFQMLDPIGREETLSDVAEIMEKLEECIA